jgi:drug/metabolite transporter (DMT)-like permease
MLNPKPRDNSTATPSKPFAWLASCLPLGLVSFCETNTGLLLVSLSHLFFVLMNITVKYFLSVSGLSALTLILVRMTITALGCIGYLLLTGDPHPFLGPVEMRPLLFARGFFGFWGLFSTYQSYLGLSVSDSVTIQFLSPSFISLLGLLYLNERLSWREPIAGLFCLVGVIFVSRPPFFFGGSGQGTPVEETPAPFPDEGDDAGRQTPERMAGVAWALVAVCCGSFARKWSELTIAHV